VFERLGCILLALGVCVWFDAPIRGTGWILQFGELSLWSYTVHLVIVYGSGASFGLDALRPQFSPVVVLLALGFVLFVTAAVVRWRAKTLQRRRVAHAEKRD
jgi:lipoprotein signal peptidase